MAEKLPAYATPDQIPAVVNNLNSDSTTDALSAAQGKALNSNFNNLIKAVTITGTTDSGGNIELTGINASDHYVISAVATTAYIVGIVPSGTGYYAKAVGNTNPLAPLTNTNVTIYVKYI